MWMQASSIGADRRAEDALGERGRGLGGGSGVRDRVADMAAAHGRPSAPRFGRSFRARSASASPGPSRARPPAVRIPRRGYARGRCSRCASSAASRPGRRAPGRAAGRRPRARAAGLARRCTPAPHPRSRLAGRLRPDVPEESARKSLRQAVYELRRDAGPRRARDVLVGHRDARRPRPTPGPGRRRATSGRCATPATSRRPSRWRARRAAAGLDEEWVLEARDEHAARAGRAASRRSPGRRGGERPGGGGRLGAAARRRRAAGRGGTPRADAPPRRRRATAPPRSRPPTRCAARLRRELGLAPSRRDARAGRGGAPRAGPRRRAVGPRAAAARAARAHGSPARADRALERLEAAWRRGPLRRAAASCSWPASPASARRRSWASSPRRAARARRRRALRALRRGPAAALRAVGGGARAPPRGRPGGRARGLARRLRRCARVPAPGLAPAGARRRRGRALPRLRGRAGVLEQAAATHGLLLVLDDLHWADAGTLRLLRHLGRTSAADPGAAGDLRSRRRAGPGVSAPRSWTCVARAS